MSSGLPRFDVREHIALITLDDPASLNAIDAAVCARLAQILDEIAGRSDVHAAILTGAGRGFCSGAGLNSLFGSVPPGVSVGEHVGGWMRDEANPMLKALNDLPVPLVTAVNGVAAGVGVGLALAGDVVVAARSAAFVIPFMPKLGIVPDGGLTWTLPRILGWNRVRALMLLGDPIGAEQAEHWGMIWRCVDDAALQDEAWSVARRLADGPAHAAREIRAALKASAAGGFDAQLDYEAGRQRELADTAAFKEGLAAFAARRPPRFPRG